MKIINHFVRLMKNDNAAISAEYALLAAVVGSALIAALVVFKDELETLFNATKDSMQNAV